MITALQLSAMVPCSFMTAETWHAALISAMEKWDISKPHRIAGWIAQLSHESRNLSVVEENLNYSAQRLCKVWPSRFPTLQSARLYEWHPQRLANVVYADRMGNGSYESGDGWRYRGRGPKQITGKDNYRDAGNALGLPLVENPDLLLDPARGADAAGWYWHSRNCNELMDRAPLETITKAKDNDFFELVTRKINGGLIGHEDGNDKGVDDRVEHYMLCCKVLGIQPGA